MELKNAIVKDDKTYGNAAFSLAISEIVQDEIIVSAAIRLVPYTDDFKTTQGIDKSIIIPIGSDNEEEKQFISEIRTAIEKLLIAKGL